VVVAGKVVLTIVVLEDVDDGTYCVVEVRTVESTVLALEDSDERVANRTVTTSPIKAITNSGFRI